jgi:hypothetical protein
MTKILYIPTGEYLQYWEFKESKYTSIIEDIELEVEEELVGLTNIGRGDYLINDWLEHNKIILPILLSELEIIYD